MAQCFKCSDVLDNMRMAATCSDCKNCFHAECTKIGSDKFKKLGVAKKTSWKCEDCNAENSSNASNASKCDLEVNTKLFERLENMQHDLSLQIKGVNDNVNDCKHKLSEVKLMVEENKSAICKLENENELRKTQYENVKKENDSFRCELNTMKDQILDLQQYSRRNNLEIAGIPFTNGENLIEILQTIAAYINVRFYPNDVSVAHRLPRDRRDRGRNVYHPKIIVSFISRGDKERWRYAARGKRLSAAELSDSFPSTPFFLNDHLTLHNKEVLGRARLYVKQQKLAMAWTNDCKMLVKKTPTGDVVRVNTINDVDDLVRNQSTERSSTNSPNNTAPSNPASTCAAVPSFASVAKG